MESRPAGNLNVHGEQTGNVTTSASAGASGSAGHRYDRVHLLDGSQAHLGDNHFHLNLGSLNATDPLRYVRRNLANYEQTDADRVAAARKAENLLIRELDYPQNHMREHKIPEAHAHTFKWIMSTEEEAIPAQWPDQDNCQEGEAISVHTDQVSDEQTDVQLPANFFSADGTTAPSFVQWLHSGRGLYWINGKPASGKSTLMKYIANHPELREHLRRWSGDASLHVASFFFYAAGTDLQRSHEGLLRSLLMTLFEARGSLVAICFPSIIKIAQVQDATAELQVTVRRPSPEELKAGFMRLLKHGLDGIKICFLVDGVDEYNGDVRDICTLLHEMALSPDIKLVVSSRPIPSCIEAFRWCAGLRLQDLTRQDIHIYVRDMLSNHTRMQLLSLEDPARAKALIGEVCNKASGVFLWVILVTRLLLNGLDNTDTIEELLAAVDSYPSQLHSLYKHMLMQMEPTRRSQASQLLQIVYQRLLLGKRSLSLLQLSHDYLDPETVFSITKQSLTKRQILLRCQTAEGRVRSRCCGLVEVVDSSERQGFYASLPEFVNRLTSSVSKAGLVETKVQFLHKTVVDFLQEPDIREFIQSLNGDPSFEANTNIVAGSLAHLTILVPVQGLSRYSHIWALMHDALFYARLAEAARQMPLTNYLNRLDVLMTRHWSCASFWTASRESLLMAQLDHTNPRFTPPFGKISGHWSSAVDYPGRTASHEESFLALAVAHDLVLYTDAVLAKTAVDKISGPLGEQLLKQTIRSFAMRPWSNFCEKKAMLICLLARGAQATDTTEESVSPWHTFLTYLAFKFTSWSSVDIDKFAQLVEVFLENGVDGNNYIDRLGRRLTLLSFIDSRLEDASDKIQTIEMDGEPIKVRAECGHAECAGFSYCDKPGHRPNDTETSWEKMSRIVEAHGGIKNALPVDAEQGHGPLNNVGIVVLDASPLPQGELPQVHVSDPADGQPMDSLSDHSKASRSSSHSASLQTAATLNDKPQTLPSVAMNSEIKSGIGRKRMSGTFLKVFSKIKRNRSASR